jgi:hypothetical protein
LYASPNIIQDGEVKEDEMDGAYSKHRKIILEWNLGK